MEALRKGGCETLRMNSQGLSWKLVVEKQTVRPEA
jgi:hypothetical protein